MARIIDARVQQKADTLENLQNNELPLLDGEQVFVRSDVDNEVIGYKVATKGKKFRDLPYPDYSARGKVSPSSQWNGRQSGIYIPTKNGVYNGIPVNLVDGYQVLYWDGSDLEKVVYPSNFSGLVFGGIIDSSYDLSSPTTPVWYIASAGTYNTNPSIVLTADSILAWNGSEWSYKPFDLEVKGDFLVADNIMEIRSMPTEAVSLLINGVYKGVELLGYYTAGDTSTIHYYVSETDEPDDSGYIIKLNDITLEHKPSNGVNVKHYGAKGDGVTDDTQSIQRAVNYVNRITPTSYLFGFTVFFPKGDYLVRNLIVNKPSYTFAGEGNRSSRILGDSELTMTVKPLWGNNDFPNSGFGGFFTRDIGIYANSDTARNSGVGIKMINCFVTDYSNLYAAGFKKNIELAGCHYNKFFNLYASDEMTGLINPNEEIFNRGYAISVSNDPASTEQGATSIHISSGWLHNTSLDLEHLSGGIIENIDIEPASNSVLVGEKQTWRNNRFERMDYYSVYVDPPKYNPFNWFIIKKDDNKFYDNDIHDLGARNLPFINAKIKVEGNNNYLSFDRKFIHFGLLDFTPESKGNTLELGRFRDEELFAETTSKNYNMERLDGTHEGINNVTLKELHSHVKIIGRQQKEIVGCSSIVSKMNSSAFIQGATKSGNVYTVSSTDGMRIIMNFNTTYTYEPGIYCLIFRLKSDIEGGMFGILSNYTNNSYANIKASDKDGLYAFRFSILPEDQLILPAIYFNSGFNIGDTFEISEIELVKMDSGAYVEQFYNVG